MAIAPGVYTKVVDKIQPVARTDLGTYAAFLFLSERGEDNKLIYLDGKDPIEIFGYPQLAKYGQGLYNLLRFFGVTSSVFGMRVLPTLDDVNYYAQNKQLPESQAKPPTFANAIVGYIRAKKTVTNTKDNTTTETVRVGLAVLNEDAMTRTGFSFSEPEPGTLDYLYNSSLGATDVNFPVTLEIPEGYENSEYAQVLWPGKDVEGTYYYELAEYVKKRGTTESTDDTETKYEAEFIPLFVIFAIGRGPWYNGLRFSIAPSAKDPNLRRNMPPKEFVFTILKTDPITGEAFELEDYVVSFDPNYRTIDGSDIFFAKEINELSNYVRVYCYAQNLYAATNTPFNQVVTDISAPDYVSVLDVLLTSMYENVQGDTIDPKSPQFHMEIYQSRATIQLTKGDFGILYDEFGVLNRELAELALMRALQGAYDPNILDTDSVFIDLVFDAGYSTGVKQEMVNLTYRRKGETFVVLDLPFARSVDQAITVRQQQFNISEPNAAIYAPYVYVNSPYENKIIKVAPSYHTARLYALNDKNFGFWWTPAGKVRGVVDEALGVTFLPVSQRDEDRLYLNQINYIKKTDIGYCFWTGLTSYKLPSARQNINVARTVAKIRRDCRLSLQYVINDNYTTETIERVKRIVDGVLSEYKHIGAIEGYTISITSTEQDKINKRLRVHVSLIPVVPLEKIELTFTV